MMWEARECYDFVDDERYRLEFQDWQPRLVRYDHATNKNVGIEPISVPLFETIEFEFETGDLLVADWFRLEGFDAEFGPEDYSQPSVNSKVGRELETRRHGRHGIVHVYVGGTSPFVFVVDGELVIGGADFDSDNLYLPDLVGAEALGRASTSLRWITVVERHRLADILVRNSGCSPEEAKAKVDAYAGEYGVVSAKIDPGKRTLYYSGDFRDFSGRFKTDELPMPQGLEPYFVISSRELRLSEEQLPAPGPKP